jgi:O-antigen ligase
MISGESSYAQKIIPVPTQALSPPSGLVEYGFYCYMLYLLVGGLFGLALNNLASGLLILLFIFTLSEVGSQTRSVISIIAFPLNCGVTYIFIQLVFFDESLIETVRPFLIWMLSLFIIQVLTLRENFLHRFVLVMSLIGLIALPYLSFYEAGTQSSMATQRAVLDKGIGFSQTNEMGAWYGFCAVYFVLLGVVARTHVSRNISWLIAVGCVYMVTLTVSRGSLLATALGSVIAIRHLLKRGFIPILLLACVVAIVIGMGLFDNTIRFYSARGTEDTGRLAVWPLIIDSFLASPLIGVGHSHVGATPEAGHFVTPHNGFLYIAQSSGIVTLTLFMAYWWRAGRAALQLAGGTSPYAAYCLPLFVYTLITANLGAFTFMNLWAIVALALPMTEKLRQQTVRPT